MGKIFCIMGKSATGKDTVYREILKKEKKLLTYVMYTTRPIRENEKDGINYHYITEDDIKIYKEKGILIESRTYNTVYGPWTYATVDDGMINPDEGDYLMPATIESYESLREYFGNDFVKPIYIDVDDGLRLLRAVKREQKEKEPKYRELCRRFLADAEDFSAEKLEKAGINRVFINDDLSRCTKEIIDYIDSF